MTVILRKLDTAAMYMYMGSNDDYTVVISWGEGEGDGANGAFSISKK